MRIQAEAMAAGLAELAGEASEQAVNANEQDLANAVDMSAPETCLGLIDCSLF